MLKSISVVCNSSPPRTSAEDKFVPPEWKRFLKWIRSNRIYFFRNLYLTLLASWNYRAAEMLVKLQGTSLKYLHLGLEGRDYGPPPKNVNFDVDLGTLHLEITHAGASTVAADIVSRIPPSNIVIVGLDIEHTLVCDGVEVENIVRLAKALKTRGFTRLRRIHVRLEWDRRHPSFADAIKILRGVFPSDLLMVESVPYEKRASVRDTTDDCARFYGAQGLETLAPSYHLH